MSGTVIIPLDGSGLAEQALPYAGWLAGHSGSVLHLISGLLSRYVG
jgi:hypothetical protein